MMQTYAFLFMLLSLAAAQNPAGDAKAIESAKSTSVRQIENSLPDKPFEKWLVELVGPQAQIVWSVNDCGEQTGDPSVDKGRDIPMCVDSQVTFAGKSKLHVLLHVGSFKTGVSTKPATFFYAVIVEANGSYNWSIKALSQLPEAIKAIK